MSSKRERPNSFAGLLNLSKPALPPTEAPVVSVDEAERAIGASGEVPSRVPTAVLTDVQREPSRAIPVTILTAIPTDDPTHTITEVLAPILRNRKKKERLLSWTVRLPESLKSRLERASKKYDIDMTAIVVAGTRDYLDRYFPE
jgi:hypothetical protein